MCWPYQEHFHRVQMGTHFRAAYENQTLYRSPQSPCVRSTLVSSLLCPLSPWRALQSRNFCLIERIGPTRGSRLGTLASNMIECSDRSCKLGRLILVLAVQTRALWLLVSNTIPRWLDVFGCLWNAARWDDPSCPSAGETEAVPF